jgi:hypothetical protein
VAVRTICCVLILLALPATVVAQHARPAEPPRSALGPIGLPLPSIGLPLPSIGLPPTREQIWNSSFPFAVPSATAEAGLQNGRHNPPRHRPRWRQPVVYFIPSYPWSVQPPHTATPQAAAPAETPPPPPQPLTGRLRLEVEPANLLQLFVDGVYRGTPGDLGNEIDLPPGSRRIEVRAPGYKTLIFDAQIAPQRTITYRGALDRDAATATPPPPPVVPAGSKTMYVIPGCYLGNVPPQDIKLPAGCDLSRLTTIIP